MYLQGHSSWHGSHGNAREQLEKLWDSLSAVGAKSHPGPFQSCTWAFPGVCLWHRDSGHRHTSVPMMYHLLGTN